MRQPMNDIVGPGVRTVGLVLLAALLAPAGATADTTGFFLGLNLHTSHVGAADETPDAAQGSVFVKENGGGLGLQLGWGITPSFPLRLSVSVAGHETTDSDVEVAYSSVTIDGLYLFRNPEPLRPYLFGGVGGFSLRSRKDALDFETTGPGVVFGGGLLYSVSERVALDFGVRGDFINWDEQTATVTFSNGTQGTVTTPIEEEGAAAQFVFGATIWI